ncbi:unnamed protein product [Polarella glacialis]|uniref:Uncharacterized protein n=1 Tax=Polarella glacialis TaxID=89957 RepID=A0A813HV65_POLGL|nr:unnamed protein product [Polarella glacialis]
MKFGYGCAKDHRQSITATKQMAQQNPTRATFEQQQQQNAADFRFHAPGGADRAMLPARKLCKSTPQQKGACLPHNCRTTTLLAQSTTPHRKKNAKHIAHNSHA